MPSVPSPTPHQTHRKYPCQRHAETASASLYTLALPRLLTHSSPKLQPFPLLPANAFPILTIPSTHTMPYPTPPVSHIPFDPSIRITIPKNPTFHHFPTSNRFSASDLYTTLTPRHNSLVSTQNTRQTAPLRKRRRREQGRRQEEEGEGRGQRGGAHAGGT